MEAGPLKHASDGWMEWRSEAQTSAPEPAGPTPSTARKGRRGAKILISGRPE